MEQDSLEPRPEPIGRFGRWPEYAKRILVAVVVFVPPLIASLLMATQHVPEFYSQALEVQPLPAEELTLTKSIEELAAQVEQEDEWELAITDQQLNQWLFTEFAKQYPRALPLKAVEPRVKFDDDKVRFACTWIDGNLNVVLSLTASFEVLNKPNKIAFQFSDPLIGAVPGLDNKARQSLTYSALKNRVRIRWQKPFHENRAELQLPQRLFPTDRTIYIDEIKVENGKVLIAGRSLPPPPKRVKPPQKKENVASKSRVRPASAQRPAGTNGGKEKTP